MAETIEQMRERHQKEIDDLQEKCPHPEISGWLRFEWAPAHSDGTVVRVCRICGKIVERRSPPLSAEVKRVEELLSQYQTAQRRDNEPEPDSH